jgi:hypothetical protein
MFFSPFLSFLDNYFLLDHSGSRPFFIDVNNKTVNWGGHV